MSAFLAGHDADMTDRVREAVVNAGWCALVWLVGTVIVVVLGDDGPELVVGLLGLTAWFAMVGAVVLLGVALWRKVRLSPDEAGP